MKNVNLKCHSLAHAPSNQRGASLLEGIAYLGIAALVILGAVSLLTGAFSSAQSNRAQEEVISIRTNVKKLYMGQAGSYAPAAMTVTLNTARAFPSTLQFNGAAAMTNAWGGLVTVAGNGATFNIVYTLVPQDVCISMISGATGWLGIAGPGVAIAAFPATPADALATCTNAAANTITFTSV